MKANFRSDIPLTSRFWTLDLIKGVPILAIVAFHVLPANSQPSFTDSSIISIYPLRYGGTLGVSIFFVLSGFGIHYSRVKRQISDPNFQPKWSSFLIRRLQRLYPAYLGAILLALSLNITWGLIRQQSIFAYLPSSYNIIIHLLFIHTLIPKTFFGIIPALWFVGTLVQLYLLYPIFYKLAKDWDINRALLAVLLFTLSARLVSQYFTADSMDIDFKSVLWCNGPQRWFEWCMGAWVAEQVSRKTRLSLNSIGLYCLLILSWLILGWSAKLIYEPFLGLLIGLMIWSLVITKNNMCESYYYFPILFLGKISYPIFLLHQIFIPYIKSIFSPSPFNPLITFIIIFILVIIITVPIATLFHQFLELPISKTRANSN